MQPVASKTQTPNGKAGRDRLFRQFCLIVVLSLAIAMTAFTLWEFQDGNDAMKATALTEARTLNAQMKASWTYVEDIQDTINYTDEGAFQFKGIYCAIAAKEIARTFVGDSSGYVIRYIRQNPRNPEDSPDEFELEALQALKDGQADEYYAVSEIDGSPVFRYVSALRADEGCLECHGKPAGSRDVTGAYREGMDLGDLAGASSIVIPLAAHEENAARQTMVSLAFFGMLMIAMVSAIRIALNRLVVEPFEKENASLEEDNKSKLYFLTLVSHELRTPLSSIVAFTDIWRSKHANRDSEDEHLVEEIRSNSNALIGLVDNIIDMAKVEAGKYEVSHEEVDIADVISQAHSVLDPLAQRKGVRLEFSLSPRTPLIASDPEALRQIVINLASNAVKFTDKGGLVRVSATMDEASGDLVVEVEDTGCGISAGEQAQLFSRFGKTTSLASANTKGSGLGLALASDLAHLLDGKLTVSSEIGKGSTFTLSIPARRGKPPSQNASQ